MKSLFSLVLSLISLLTVAQPAPTPDRPTVPDQVTFADMTVRFDPDAQRLIQQDINALVANRSYWYAKLDRALLYFPLMENALLTDEMPTDLKYMAIQESSLTPDAVSSSQAVGFWQFKRETAGDYGLTVNDQVDERKHILASTHAAARYLRRSYGMYNNWVSALFSFYLGTGGISKIVSPDWANSRDITLDGRTDRYMLRFFAHKLAIEYALKTYQPTLPFALVEYPGGGGKNITTIAADLNIPAADIRSYNRWLLTDDVPADKAYILTIPTPNNQINDVRQRLVTSTGTKLKNIPTDDIGFPVLKLVTTGSRSANEPILYEINGLPGVQAQANDNSESLARKSKISLSSFLRFNDLGERDPLVVGEVYYLAKKRKKALVPFHTARPDETMRSISQRYSIRLKKVLRYNRMDRVQKLQIGRVLWLREKRPNSKPIEVITAPTQPVYDSSPATPSTRPVAGQSNDDARTAINNIPRNASERKRYQPKLVGSTIPTAEVTPAMRNQPRTDADPLPPMTRPTTTVDNTPATAPNTPPANAPAASPTPSVTIPATEVITTTVPRDAGSPQRTIIVRAEGEPERQRTTPARTMPEDNNRDAVVRNQPRVDTDPLPPMTRPVATTTYPQTPDPVTNSPTKRAVSQPVGLQADMGIEQPPVTKKGQEAPMRNQPLNDPQPLPPMTRPATPDDAPRPDAARTTVPNNRTATTTSPRPDAPASRTMTSSPNSRSIAHTVEAGQTFYSLSRYYGIRVEDLLKANELTLGDKLSVGQKLAVPNVPAGYPTGQPASSKTVAVTTPEETTPATQPEPGPVKTSTPTHHTVAKGETLYRISKQYDVSIEQLMEWNKLPDLGVKEGQKLRVSQ